MQLASTKLCNKDNKKTEIIVEQQKKSQNSRRCQSRMDNSKMKIVVEIRAC